MSLEISSTIKLLGLQYDLQTCMRYNITATKVILESISSCKSRYIKSSSEVLMMKTNKVTCHRWNVITCWGMSSLAGYAEGAHFHVGSNHKRSLRRFADSKFVMHEAAVNYGVIFENNLIAVTALQAHLIMVALVGPILHLLKIPYHTKLSYCRNQVALLLPILGYLPNLHNVKP